MTIGLDHVIVPAKDKVAAARFFAEIFGLAVDDRGRFARVQVNQSLTFDFADAAEAWGSGPGFDPGVAQSLHYAFHVSDDEFDAILTRLKAKGVAYGSNPFSHADGQLYARRGGRGLYFEDLNAHLIELMTVPETGS
jgi:catechol 2,3-dioxygenase-like lactoylglutathione lyase family enzyme